jgi:CelD/BcsL family acetyltransferase involved in cellulose biosynthesis
MSSLQLRQLDSAEALRASATAWDDLWRRSETTIPTVRGELVALWLEQFAPAGPFRALVVEEKPGGRMLAALPLAEKRVGRVVRCGGLTSNYWSPNGELLLDPEAATEEVLDMLLDGVEKLDWPLFWFDMVPVDAPHWKATLQALNRRGLKADVHSRWQVGKLVFPDDMDAYFASRSKNLRRNLRKNARRLEQEAPLGFTLESTFTHEQVEERLREVFTIEDRSWKGEAGGSVLRHPEMFEFYRRQARQLADWGDLRVARLIHGDRTIAFDLGWIGANTFHLYKIGYDPAYRNFGPGHLLRERVIRALAEQGDVRAIDFQGPMIRAIADWANDDYRIARVVIAQRRATAQALRAGYHGLGRLVRLSRRMRRP